MDIQTRKLVLIEEFLRISDENLIIKLETFLQREKLTQKERIKPMTLDDFHGMINDAKQDYVAGRTITHDDLKKKVKKWK